MSSGSVLPPAWVEVRTGASTSPAALLGGRVTVAMMQCRFSVARDGDPAISVSLYDVERLFKLSGLSNGSWRSARTALAAVSAGTDSAVYLLYLPATGSTYTRQEALETKTRQTLVYGTVQALEVILLQYVSPYTMLGELVRLHFQPAATHALLGGEEEEEEELPARLVPPSKRGPNGDEVAARYLFRDGGMRYRTRNSPLFSTTEYSKAVGEFERCHVEAEQRRFCFDSGLGEAVDEAVREAFDALQDDDDEELQEIRRESKARKKLAFIAWSEHLFVRYVKSPYFFRADADALEAAVTAKYPDGAATYTLELFLLVVYYHLALPFVKLYSSERTIRGVLELVGRGPPPKLIERKPKAKKVQRVPSEVDEEDDDEEEDGDDEEEEDDDDDGEEDDVDGEDEEEEEGRLRATPKRPRSGRVFGPPPVSVKRRRR